MNEPHKINYGKLIDPDKKYPVTYTIKQNGDKVFKKKFIWGCDLTEKQIKEIIDLPETRIKGTWGGKRERKTKAEPTKVMRIPVSKVDQVYEIINGKITTHHKMP